MSKGNRKRRRELGLLPEPVKCSARTRNGNPCSRSPIKGGTVCPSHGGRAPQTKRKAQERLLKEVPAMLLRLRDLASDESVPPAVRLAAIRDWLDRAGINAKTEVEVTIGGWQDLIHGIVATVPEDSLTGIGGGDYSGYAAMNGLVLDNVVDAEVVDEAETP
jgi:hypothetical protein